MRYDSQILVHTFFREFHLAEMDFDKKDVDIILVLLAASGVSNLLLKSRRGLVWVKTLVKTHMNKMCL